MKTYEKYQTLKDSKAILTYSDLLYATEWQDKRESILVRDKYTCQKCRKRPTILYTSKHNGQKVPHDFFLESEILSKEALLAFGIGNFSTMELNGQILYLREASESRVLHVHHLLYIKGNLPWQYEDKALVTLCADCHTAWHRKYVPRYYVMTAQGLLQQSELTPCSRCYGSGWFPQYSHIRNGECFRCEGARFEEMRWPTATPQITISM